LNLTSIPSLNFTFRITFGSWFRPSRRFRVFSAACASLKIMQAQSFSIGTLWHVRWRTVAKVLSIGYDGAPCQGALFSPVGTRAGELSLQPEAFGVGQEAKNDLKHPNMSPSWGPRTVRAATRVNTEQAS
jgi:hypothetical protein